MMSDEIKNGDVVSFVGDDGQPKNCIVVQAEREVLQVYEQGFSTETFCIERSDARLIESAPEIVDALVLMSEEEARSAIAQIRQGLENVRALVDDLYAREGYKALGYSSWRDCVVAEFGQSQAYAYRLLAAAQIERQISPNGEIGKIPELHLRPLSKLPEEDRAQVWQEAVSTAPQGKLTGAYVAEVVNRRLGKPEAAKPIVETVAELPAEPKKENLPEPAPAALIQIATQYLQVQPAGAYAMPPQWPWLPVPNFINLLHCKDIDLWVERSLATAEQMGDEIGLLIWVPAEPDRDWWRRVRGNVCFIASSWLAANGSEYRKPTAIIPVGVGRQIWKFVRAFESAGDCYTWVPPLVKDVERAL